jgi:hypothetical protein
MIDLLGLIERLEILVKSFRQLPLLLTLACAPVAPALADDVDVVVQEVNMIHMSPEQIAQWVFGNQGNAQNARKSAEAALKLQVDFVAQIGDLSDVQRAKLQLAGQGDIHRFFELFERIQRDTPTGNIPQDQWQQVWQRLQPLQNRFAAGIHGRSSLFRRTIRSALSPPQLAKYESLDRERRRQHYHAIVRATVATIEAKIPLTAAQRGKLIDLVMSQTEPPDAWGQSYYQYYFVLYAMSKIPEPDIKPIFLDNEWKVMQAMLNQGRGWEHQFRQMNDVDFDANVIMFVN